MFNPRTALVLVAPLVCAALVACRASVGEDVRVTGEAEPAMASSDPSDPASPSPSPRPSDPTLVPTPASGGETGGGAASEEAPVPTASAADAGDAATDAPADVAPPPPYSCIAPAMSTYATAKSCSTPTAASTAGGVLQPGTYVLSTWWNSKICLERNSYTRSGTMVIEVIDGVTYMRWRTGGTTTATGTASLTPIDGSTTSLTRSELCGASRGLSYTVNYWTSATELVLARPGGETSEQWTKLSTKIFDPREPIDIKF
jgi:hypothetical protein